MVRISHFLTHFDLDMKINHTFNIVHTVAYRLHIDYLLPTGTDADIDTDTGTAYLLRPVLTRFNPQHCTKNFSITSIGSI